ncbi:MAG: alkaline phosphatase family protein [Colwellia sp.]|nr:alkaline phosphatase family protein [Colwellia sp.]
MLKDILVGPILRRLTPQQLVLWWVSPYVCSGELRCYSECNKAVTAEQNIFTSPFSEENLTSYCVGEKAFVHLLDVSINLPVETYIEYDLLIRNSNDLEGVLKPLAQLSPNLAFPEQRRSSFIIQDKINNLLHGSCRNPHHASQDSLLAGETLVGKTLTDNEQRPTLLMMSGDQIYADHVAGTMLYAIHQVIALLGLNDESFSDTNLSAQGVNKGSELYQFSEQYFQRELLLPKSTVKASWYRPAKQQAIFTSTYAHNHVMTFAENMAMYFLVWSPTLWQYVELEGFNVPAKYQKIHQQELAAIKDFVSGLDKVQRLLAHIPTYMIFDDHDVTDDWNLTAAWEQAAYQDPLAKRIIGNSLFAYWLCQGWGNDPKQFKGDFFQIADSYQQQPDCRQHDAFVDYLLKFSHWQYTVDSQPKLVVLDSRTRRWRSEHSLDEPSGLMDWEALCELQQELIGHDSILLVSPAPIFGVKVIETIQRMATIAGQPLAVDAENWMAHPGAASTLLNIFRHPKTPQHFVILSGDVHYSFVYDIELRFRHHSPHIWQITSSGIKNQFPQPLIGIFDRVNRWLYGPYSPLNLFTKRRAMRIKGRKLIVGTGEESINQAEAKKLKLGHQRLQPLSGLGYLELNDDGSPHLIADLHANGSKTVFIESSEELMP